METNQGLEETIKQFHEQANIACEELKIDFATVTYIDSLAFLLLGKQVRVVENIYLSEVEYFKEQGLTEFEVVGYSRWNRLPQPSLN
jgi:hypothetical protein